MSQDSGLVIGRIDPALVDAKHATVFDLPNQTAKAIITKLDQILAWQAVIGAAITTATDGPSLYTALNTVAAKTAIDALRFML